MLQHRAVMDALLFSAALDKENVVVLEPVSELYYANPPNDFYKNGTGLFIGAWHSGCNLNCCYKVNMNVAHTVYQSGL